LLRVEHRLVRRLSLSQWLVRLVLRVRMERWCEGMGGVGTLLGPEGAGDASRSVRQRRPH